MALRNRFAGTDFKPLYAAAFKRCGSERYRKGRALLYQVPLQKMTAREPLMKCRKRRNDVKTGGKSLTRDKPRGHLVLLSGRHPAQRWHDLYGGVIMELGNLSFRC